MAPHVTLDFETRSKINLKKSGAYRYSVDDTTEVLCLAYRIDDGERKLWTPHFGTDCPADLAEAIAAGAELEGHGAWFEFCIWWNFCVLKWGWPRVENSQWFCSMVAGAYRGMPMALDTIGRILNIEHEKDKRGKRLITLLCMPRTPAEMKKAAKRGDTSIWEDDPLLFEELYEYCVRDTLAEDEVSDAVGTLPPSERELWQLDQSINRRGVKIDVPLIRAAQKLVRETIASGERRLYALTGGAVQTVGQTARMQAWLDETQHLPISGMDKDTIDDYLTHWDMTGEARELLQLRKSLARTSVKKLDAMLAWCGGDDDRLRGMFQYYGAMSTGRWAGRGPQPQNFPRPTLSLPVDVMVDLIYSGDIEFIQATVGDPLDLVADALRSMFIADDGKQFNSSDFSAIEAITTAGIAGEQRKLQIFRDGKDPYCEFAQDVFGYPVNKKDNPDERQVGKTGELAFGFEGGVNAWRNFDSSDRSDEEIKGYRDIWRGNHPRTTDLWLGLNEACKEAIRNPGKAFSYGPITYQVIRHNGRRWMAARLPSGRCLWYHEPGIEPKTTPWGALRDTAFYWAWKEGQWKKTFTFGGKLTENVVQAAARDILVYAMFNCEREGYPVVMHSHDEIVAEVPLGTPLEPMEEIFSRRLPWFEDWPVKGEGWIGQRYRK